jgi:hypothetical protein
MAAPGYAALVARREAAAAPDPDPTATPDPAASPDGEAATSDAAAVEAGA